MRQTVWQAIEQAKQSGTSFMVATHNMEEADLLCNRIGIMANGELQCVGAPLELKQRYASALKLSLSLLPPSARNLHRNEPYDEDQIEASTSTSTSTSTIETDIEHARRVDQWVLQQFPSASLSRSFALVREYSIPIASQHHHQQRGAGDDDGGAAAGVEVPAVEMAEVFAAMEQHKQRLAIGEWSISQASLEDVFLSIVGEPQLID